MKTDLLEPRNCACFNIRRAARKITQAYDAALKPSGITASQFSLLAVLQSKNQESGVPLSVLAKSLGMDRTTLSRNLQLAQQSGWIELSPGEDRRERRISLTSAGRAKVEEALPYWKEIQDSVLLRLGDAEMGRIVSLADRL